MVDNGRSVSTEELFQAPAAYRPAVWTVRCACGKTFMAASRSGHRDEPGREAACITEAQYAARRFYQREHGMAAAQYALF